MSNSKEMRRLQAKWQQGTGWPKRLEWLEIQDIRGWDGQHIQFNFPIVALVGENGSGKSTVLQCAASVYQPAKNSDLWESWFASDFFPKTIWEDIRAGEIRFSVREGERITSAKIHKPTERWRGNTERPERSVNYIDLRRLQPIAARAGYSKLLREAKNEIERTDFDKDRLSRLSQILGWNFDSARIAITDANRELVVPVFETQSGKYSGYHAGSGQTTVAEFLGVEPDQTALLVIDEIETSLHPSAQRRLIRDLANMCRERDLQIIVSTHSPYVLAELPPEARIYLMQGQSGRHVMTGVSPEFAMTRMDEYPHPECEIYVEDERAQTMLREIIVAHSKGVIERCSIVPYGAASVGRSLGIMVFQKRFIRPSCVFLDGDQAEAPGCLLLPGGDAPERVVFGDLQKLKWDKLSERTGRSYSEVADACDQAMTLIDHHEWVKVAASKLVIPGDSLWQAMCQEWATRCLDQATAKTIIQAVSDLMPSALMGVSSPIVRMPLFEQSRSVFDDQVKRP